MDAWMGYLAIGLGVLGSIYTLFTKPMHKLEIQLTTFNENMKTLQSSDATQNNKLKEHEEKLWDHEGRIKDIEREHKGYYKDRKATP